MSVTSRWIDVGAGEVAIRTIGSGPDVLFVHGWPVSGATFRHLVPHLADHVTCHVIDLPGAGESRFDDDTEVSVDRHIESIRRVVDELGVDDLAVVAHDSGGLIARHALAGDRRVRAWGLLDTEQPQGLTWRFKQFLVARHLPGFPVVFRFILGNRWVRRGPTALGGAFEDRALLDGEFDELFLRPIVDEPLRLRAAIRLLESVDVTHIEQLGALHRQMTQPVHLVWGESDPFFPLAWAQEMATEFDHGRLTVVPNARLFAHEEQPERVAAALVPTLSAAIGGVPAG